MGLNEIPAPQLPFKMDPEVWGDALQWEEVALGVFDIYTTLDNRPDANGHTSFYAVVEAVNIVISEKALQCASKYDNGVYYFTEEEQQLIVEYELLKMRLEDAAPDLAGSIQESMGALDDLGKEICPEYFGTWPTPEETPWGHVEKCVEVVPGVWLLRVGNQWVLSVTDLLCSNLHDLPMQLGKSDGPVFWKMDEAAPAIYELINLEGFRNLEQYISSMEALEAYLCDFYPDYVSFYNGLLDSSIEEDKKGRGLFVASYEREKIKKTCPTVSEYLNADVFRAMEG
ncbi:hypothetical protein [Pseudoflavonifractor phocaeensis]|uniref:hypothetical protein n=1 Tax=Pseudoflavonifractor phocaeensis TaxID=1870988 RepID=UPI00210B9713|nr:hypothetical protein [Pseudoflavonifractor phocaeensis]MCQ4864943.1 hypothetical protein [Pseudoflavonifractor phocaeensis]